MATILNKIALLQKELDELHAQLNDKRGDIAAIRAGYLSGQVDEATTEANLRIAVAEAHSLENKQLSLKQDHETEATWRILSLSKDRDERLEENKAMVAATATMANREKAREKLRPTIRAIDSIDAELRALTYHPGAKG